MMYVHRRYCVHITDGCVRYFDKVEPMVKADIILGGDNNTIVDEAKTTASAPQNLVSPYMLFTYHAMISI